MFRVLAQGREDLPLRPDATQTQHVVEAVQDVAAAVLLVVHGHMQIWTLCCGRSIFEAHRSPARDLAQGGHGQSRGCHRIRDICAAWTTVRAADGKKDR